MERTDSYNFPIEIKIEFERIFKGKTLVLYLFISTLWNQKAKIYMKTINYIYVNLFFYMPRSFKTWATIALHNLFFTISFLKKCFE